MPESVVDAQGKIKIKRSSSVICANIRGVRNQFDCVLATEISRSDSECTGGSDWAKTYLYKSICRGQLHFNTIPVKKEGKKNGLNI